MTPSATISRTDGMIWPAAMLVTVLVWAVSAPTAFIAIVTGAVLLVLGWRYPVATAGAVLVAIPIIDQAIAENNFTELFGALRVTPAVAMKAMMAFVMVSYLVRKRINPLRYRLLRPMLIWLGYTMATCFLFHDRGMAFSMWMRLAYWTTYFVFFFIVAAQECHPSSRKVMWLWRAGLIAAAIFAGSVFLAKALGVGGDFYGVGESYGFYADPWNMALTLPGGLVLALLYPWVMSDKRLRTGLACGSLVLAVVLASYLTFTRTSLFASIAAVLLFTFTLKRVSLSPRTSRMFALAIAMTLCAVLFVVRNITSTASDNRISARWSEVDKGSVGSGRLEVFYAAWSKFTNASPVHKVVGHGIGAGPEAAEEYTGVYVFLHDDLLEMLVCAGLVGVALYCWCFGRLYRAVLAGFRAKDIWAVAALTSLAVYNLTAVSYMRIYAVTPNTYFVLVAGTSMGMLHRRLHEQQGEQTLCK